LPARGLAQDSATHTSASTKPSSPSKATASKKPGSTAAKTHSASHSATVKPSKAKTTPVAHKGKVKYASSRKSGKRKPRGQQKIDSERAEAIREPGTRPAKTPCAAIRPTTDGNRRKFRTRALSSASGSVRAMIIC
jgi:hypothetical protein